VYGGRPNGRTERLRLAVERGVASAEPGAVLTSRHALDCGTDELVAAQGLLLGTPEHFGYMSGALKDFFDRTYYPSDGRTQGLPYALFVSAGTEGQGTVRAVERIATGYGWASIAPALIVVGEPDAAALAKAAELGATLAAGLAAGIF
jgi:multimeric flavodoxin WrbA